MSVHEKIAQTTQHRISSVSEYIFVTKRLYNPQSKHRITRRTLNTHTIVHTPIPGDEKNNEMQIFIFLFRLSSSVTFYKDDHFPLLRAENNNKRQSLAISIILDKATGEMNESVSHPPFISKLFN